MNDRPLLTYENKILALMSLTFGFVMFDRLALNMLLPFIAPELGLNNTQIGLLASGLGLAWAISGYVVARVADRQQRRKQWFIASVTLFSLASISSGLATSFIALLATRICLGLAEGPVLPLAQTIMAAESSEHRRGFNLGLLQNLSSSVLGNLLAPIVLVWLATAFSWRSAFFIASVPGLLLAILCARTLREPKAPVQAPGVEASAPGLRQLLANRNMVQSTVIACAMVTWLILQLIFLPIYLTKVRGMSAQHMGMLLSLAAISSVIAAVFVSKLSDVIGRRPTLIAFSLLGMVGPLGVVFLDASLGTLVVPLFIGYLACGCLPQAAATVPSESVPPHMLATAVAFAVGTAEIVGGFVAPLVAGAAGDAFAPSAPLLIAAAAALLSACTALFLHESAPLKLARTQRKQSLVA